MWGWDLWSDLKVRKSRTSRNVVPPPPFPSYPRGWKEKNCAFLIYDHRTNNYRRAYEHIKNPFRRHILLLKIFPLQRFFFPSFFFLLVFVSNITEQSNISWYLLYAMGPENWNTSDIFIHSPPSRLWFVLGVLFEFPMSYKALFELRFMIINS